MDTRKPPFTAEERAGADGNIGAVLHLIGLMEEDGDFGPEWAKIARDMLQDVEDFVHYDPRDVA